MEASEVLWSHIGAGAPQDEAAKAQSQCASWLAPLHQASFWPSGGPFALLTPNPYLAATSSAHKSPAGVLFHPHPRTTILVGQVAWGLHTAQGTPRKQNFLLLIQGHPGALAALAVLCAGLRSTRAGPWGQKAAFATDTGERAALSSPAARATPHWDSVAPAPALLPWCLEP